MYWYLQLSMQLNDAPWPATKDELIDYAVRNCLDDQVVQNLGELDDDDYSYLSMSEIWPEFSDWIDDQNQVYADY